MGKIRNATTDVDQVGSPYVRWPTTVTAKQKSLGTTNFTHGKTKLTHGKIKKTSWSAVGQRLVSGCYLYLKWYVV